MSLGPDSHSTILSDLIAAYVRGFRHRGQLKLVAAIEQMSGGRRRWNVRTKYGFRIAVDLNDMVQKTIMDTGAWDEAIADALDARWSAEDTFFDVGANIGFFTLQALQRGLRVAAFEPMPPLADLVAANVVANRFPDERSTLIRSALGSKAGRAAYRPGPGDNSGAGRLVSDTLQSDIIVPVLTLDEFLAVNPSLRPTVMKIDVEGHEVDVLRGATSLLQNDPPHTIVFEADVTGACDIADEDISDILRRAGYAIEKIDSAPLDGKANFIATSSRNHSAARPG